jgi:hypothetical protein
MLVLPANPNGWKLVQLGTTARRLQQPDLLMHHPLAHSFTIRQ